MASIRSKPKPPPIWQYGAYLCDECGETDPLKFNASSPHLCRACGGTKAGLEAEAKATAQKRKIGQKGPTPLARVCLTCGETEWSKFAPKVKRECRACYKARVKKEAPTREWPKTSVPWKCPKCKTTDETLRIKNVLCSNCNKQAIRESRNRSQAWQAATTGQGDLETKSTSGKTNGYNLKTNQYLTLQLAYLRKALGLDAADVLPLNLLAIMEKQHTRCHACGNQIQFWGYMMTLDETKWQRTDTRERWYATDRVIVVCNECSKLKEWKRAQVIQRVILRILEVGEELIKTHLASTPQ